MVAKVVCLNSLISNLYAYFCDSWIINDDDLNNLQHNIYTLKKTNKLNQSTVTANNTIDYGNNF